MTANVSNTCSWKLSSNYSGNELGLDDVYDSPVGIGSVGLEEEIAQGPERDPTSLPDMDNTDTQTSKLRRPSNQHGEFGKYTWLEQTELYGVNRK